MITANIKAQLSKCIYFSDEKIQLDIEIDNTMSRQPLYSIEVVFKQTVTIMRKLNYETKNNLVEELDLEVVQLGDIESGATQQNVQIEFDLD